MGIKTYYDTQYLSVQNDAAARVAGAINVVNPLAWGVKIFADILVRCCEDFYFSP